MFTSQKQGGYQNKLIIYIATSKNKMFQKRALIT